MTPLGYVLAGFLVTAFIVPSAFDSARARIAGSVVARIDQLCSPRCTVAELTIAPGRPKRTDGGLEAVTSAVSRTSIRCRVLS
jgi:hypothetical protein